MKNSRFLIYLLLAAILLCSLSGCTEAPVQPSGTVPETTTAPTDVVDNYDYAGTMILDMDSATLKQEVSVKQFIDGDTTHFFIPTSVNPSGVLKARYLGINTPLSTPLSAPVRSRNTARRPLPSPRKSFPPLPPSLSNQRTATGMQTPPVTVTWFGCGTSPRAPIPTAT